LTPCRCVEDGDGRPFRVGQVVPRPFRKTGATLDLFDHIPASIDVNIRKNLSAVTAPLAVNTVI
jgi:hypothetical protein